MSIWSSARVPGGRGSGDAAVAGIASVGSAARCVGVRPAGSRDEPGPPSPLRGVPVRAISSGDPAPHASRRGQRVLEEWVALVAGDALPREGQIRALLSTAAQLQGGRLQSSVPGELVSLLAKAYARSDDALRLRVLSLIVDELGTDERALSRAARAWLKVAAAEEEAADVAAAEGGEAADVAADVVATAEGGEAADAAAVEKKTVAEEGTEGGVLGSSSSVSSSPRGLAVSPAALPSFSRARRSAQTRALASLEAATRPSYESLIAASAATPGGIAFLVRLRADCRRALKLARRRRDAAVGAASAPPSLPSPAHLSQLDAHLRSVLAASFAPGLVRVSPLAWETAGAGLLERLMVREAVHPFVGGWAELKARLGRGRRAFVATHPCLEHDPLAAVYVRLGRRIPRSVDEVMRDAAADADEAHAETGYTVATFYSISSMQPGLAGIDLGHQLILRAASALRAEHPSLDTLCTLSPIPGLATWVFTHVLGADWERDVPGAEGGEEQRERGGGGQGEEIEQGTQAGGSPRDPPFSPASHALLFGRHEPWASERELAELDAALREVESARGEGECEGDAEAGEEKGAWQKGTGSEAASAPAHHLPPAPALLLRALTAEGAARRGSDSDSTSTPAPAPASAPSSTSWRSSDRLSAALRPILLRLAARYLLSARRRGEALDRVAAFHLRNGAIVGRLRWDADPSPGGTRRSFGIMVNYLYRPKELDENNRAYVLEGRIQAEPHVQTLARIADGD